MLCLGIFCLWGYEFVDVLDLKVVPFRGAELTVALREQGAAGYAEAFGWSAEMSAADFANEHAEFYVLLRGSEELLGFVSLHHVLDEATVNGVIVLPEWRQQGLAGHLLAFVLEQLAARDVVHVFLEVRALNVAARALYASAGFEELVVRKAYYHNPVDDAVIMQKRLGEEV